MIFKELGILNFGKFEDKIIKLDSGINLICGDNESGKSTVVNFIDGIFYGFSRDSLAKKIKDDLFYKSRPWDSSLYRGFIILKDCDEFRVTRDFEKDEVSILKLETSEEFSEDAKNYKYSRISQPGSFFFDMNRKLYKSSFFISQRFSEVEKDAAEELRNRIDNFSVSEDENVDLNKILEKMKSDFYDLGTERRKASEIGRISENLKNLNSKKTNLILDKEKYEEATSDYSDAKNEIKSLEYKLRGRKLFELKKLKEELEKLTDKKDEDEKSFDFKDLEKAIEINRTSGIYLNKLDELNSRNDTYQFEVNDEVEKDYKKYKEIKNEIEILDENNFSKEREIISSDIKSTKRVVLFCILKVIFSLIGAVLIILGSVYYDKHMLSLISIIFFGYAYFRFVKFRQNKDLLFRLESKLRDYKKKSIEKTKRKRDFDKFFEELIKKYDANSIDELAEILENERDKNLKNISKNEYNKIWSEKSSQEIESINGKIIEYEKELKNIFHKYNVKNISELKEVFYNLKDKKVEEISKLKFKIQELEKENLSGEVYSEKSISELEKEMRESLLKISNLEGILKTLEDSMENLRILEEETSMLEEKLQRLKYKRSLLEISINKFEDFIKYRRRDTIPKLKENISNYLSDITSSKYTEILIDDRFNIKVYDKNVKDYIDFENLSLGTIDEIYLAFRLAISKIITDKKIPLVLDSHFDSYDDIRLSNTLRVLDEEEQVLIFTSSNREKEILDRNNMTYNLIRL